MLETPVNDEKLQVGEPLDTLLLPYYEEGVTLKVSALDIKWVKPRCFLYFCQLPEQDENGSFILGARETWLEHVNLFCEDMKWLLKLEQHKFWSQMTYDNGAMASVVSFLQEALPCYALEDFPEDERMWKAYEECHCLVLLIMKRLATSQESETSYITPKLHGELLYDNYLFTIPILLDLCLLYGQNNRSLLLQIFCAVFNMQPKYTEDLKKSAEYITQVLHGVGNSVGIKIPQGSNPEKLPQQIECLNAQALKDLIIHIQDISYSLSFLLDIFSPACKIFHQEGFEMIVVWFYENVVPELYNKLEIYIPELKNPALFKKLKCKLDVARVEFIKSFRHMLFSCINRTIEKRDSLDEAEVFSCVDDYVNILTECLSEKLFICDYHHMFNVGMDLDVLAQLSPDMDSEKRGYILEGVIDCLDDPVIPLSPTAKEAFSMIRFTDSNGTTSTSEVPQNAESSANTECSGDSVKKVSGVKLDSLISQVKDILPHLGDGFVEKCLDYFKYQSEDVIHAILEGNLPSELQELHQGLPRIFFPENEKSQNPEETVVNSEDEKPVYVEAHKGKRKSAYNDILMMINDKSHREDCREFFNQQSLYEDDYDDTYDDRLDASIAGGDDDDPESKQTWIGQGQKSKTNVSSSDDESADENTAAPADQFVRNPEELRAQYERLQMYHRSSKNVVGRPKGQGQDKNVVVNRNQKTVNKSRQGNHNRRVGAQRKRQFGMIPS